MYEKCGGKDPHILNLRNRHMFSPAKIWEPVLQCYWKGKTSVLPLRNQNLLKLWSTCSPPLHMTRNNPLVIHHSKLLLSNSFTGSIH